MSPLSKACSDGQYKEVRALLDAGTAFAQVELDDALAEAAKSGRCDSETKCKLLELLLQRGARIDEDKFDEEWLVICSPQCEKLVRLLAERNAFYSEGERRRFLENVLDASCRFGGLATVEVVLELGPKVTGASDDWISPALTTLMSCSLFSDDAVSRVFDLLLAKGADINGGPSSDRSPLGAAVEHGDALFVRLLLEKGAYVDRRGRDGRTPLLALCAEDPEEEEALSVETALECAKLLLEYGADVDLCDDEGISAFEWAIINGKTELADLLFDYYKHNLPEY